MGKQKRPEYKRGEVSLGWRGAEPVAEYRDHSGKRRRKRLNLKGGAPLETIKQAIDAFAEALLVVRTQQASHTVGDLWKLWLKEREADGLPNAIYEANWVPLAPVFAARYPANITAQDCRDYAKARFAAGMKPWTVHTELVRLRACLKWAADVDKIPKRPKMWVPQPGEGRKRVLTYVEARAILKGASEGDPHVYVFVVLLFATGARHMAVLDLTWDRIDFIEGTIQYDENLPRDPMSKAWRKGRATVPMSRLARSVLEVAHRGRQTDHVVEHGGKRLKDGREGFRNAVERAHRLLGEKSKLGKYVDDEFKTSITPHVVRHTVATWLDAASVQRARTAQLLGHADERTTQQIYTHADADVLRDAVTALDQAITPPDDE